MVEVEIEKLFIHAATKLKNVCSIYGTKEVWDQNRKTNCPPQSLHNTRLQWNKWSNPSTERAQLLVRKLPLVDMCQHF